MPEKTCQNRKGKNCLQFRGKNIYYKDAKDLSRILLIPEKQAKSLINDRERLIIDEDGKVEKINLKNNPLPLLTREFNIKRIANKKLTAIKLTKIKNSNIAIELSENVLVEVLLMIKMRIEWFTDGKSSIETRNKEVYYKGYSGDIEKFVDDYGEEYAQEASGVLTEISFKVITIRNRKKLEWKKGKLRENYVYDLTEFCNIMYSDDVDGNCVKLFLKEKYPKISKKYIDSLGDEDGVSIQEIMDFCNAYEIKCFIFDVLGTLKYENDKNNKSYANLSFIAYNNHIYPLEHKLPKKKKQDTNEFVIVDDCFSKIKKLVKKRKIPYKLNIDVINNKPDEISDINIISYIYNDKKYIANNEYERCLEILKKFKLEDHIYDSIKLQNIGSIIEKKYIMENIESFLPNQELFQKGGFIFKTEKEIDTKRKITTIDKNKAYTYCLYILPYLIVCDWRIAEIIKNPKKIIDHYLYIAKPFKSTILIPNTNMYSGYFLKKCKKYGIGFELLEEISTTIVINHYKKMIDDMIKKLVSKETFKDDWDLIKNAINILIGRMERSTHVTNKFICNGILNNDENKTHDGFSIKIDDNHNINFDCERKVTNIYNRKPIAMQIKDMCRLLVFERMKELKLSDNDIIQIKTDSISYYGEPSNDLDPTNFHGWKKENQMKEMDFIPDVIDNPELTFYFTNKNTVMNPFKDPNDYNNKKYETKDAEIDYNKYKYTRKLHNCYAGCGKTTYIINELIPILKEKKIKFRVLTPSHSALEEYRKQEIICDVIQKYTFENSIPEEDYIIIDEIGFVDRIGHDLLYKLSMLDKNYECFGDFGQLLPVKEQKEYSADHYNNYLYNDTTTKLTKNRRNNIPYEYYESLKNEELNVKEEVHKYSKRNWKNAEVILCYHNWVKDKYNKLMLSKLNKKHGDIGVKYICKTNDLLEEYGIYNHKQIEIIDKIKDTEYNNTYYYELSDGNIITQKQLEKNFDLGYAMNAYQVQGKTIKSYYWAREDDAELENKKAGRLAYTIISRLSGNVYKNNIINDQTKIIEV